MIKITVFVDLFISMCNGLGKGLYTHSFVTGVGSFFQNIVPLGILTGFALLVVLTFRNGWIQFAEEEVTTQPKAKKQLEKLFGDFLLNEPEKPAIYYYARSQYGSESFFLKSNYSLEEVQTYLEENEGAQVLFSTKQLEWNQNTRIREWMQTELNA